ncbi:MAG: hypothetical protein L0Y56_05165 [Nitrospira sp.]|nr:hypothetical protein [Nitrospira sp.]
MARTALTVNSVPKAGVLEPTLTSQTATDGFSVVTGYGVFVRVKCTNAAGGTLTLVTPGTVDGLAVADRTVTFALNDIKYIAVNDPVLYGATLNLDTSVAEFTATAFTL